jgi:hypothetical protein
MTVPGQSKKSGFNGLPIKAASPAQASLSAARPEESILGSSCRRPDRRQTFLDQVALYFPVIER